MSHAIPAKVWVPVEAGVKMRRAAGLLLLGAVALLLAWAPLTWLAVGVGTAAWAAASLCWPAASLAAIGFAIPLGGLLPLPVAGADAVDLLVAVAVITWLLQGMASHRLVFRMPALGWVLLAFLWFAALSLTQASAWHTGVREWLKWAEFAVIYLIAAQLGDRRRAAWVVAGLMLAGAAQAVLGGTQFLSNTGPEAFTVLGRFGRAYGTFRQPNPYGGYLGYLAPVAFSFLLAAAGRRVGRRGPRDLRIGASAALLTLILLAGIVASWSRGAWLGITTALLGVLALQGRKMVLILAAIALLAIAAVGLGASDWLPHQILDGLAALPGQLAGPDPAQVEISDANFSVLERLAHWQAGWRMFGDHPWLGVGIGNYEAAYPTYALPHWYEPLGHAHNAFVNFLAETGILGFGAFALLWLGIAWTAWSRSRRWTGYPAALALGVLGSWLYLSVHSLFDNLFVQHMHLQLALLVGLLQVGEQT